LVFILQLSKIKFNNEMYLHGCCNRSLDSELSANVAKEVASGLRVPFSGMMQRGV
jgi:putative salt-induced outer membrane protein YdiY